MKACMSFSQLDFTCQLPMLFSRVGRVENQWPINSALFMTLLDKHLSALINQRACHLMGK